MSDWHFGMDYDMWLYPPVDWMSPDYDYELPEPIEAANIEGTLLINAEDAIEQVRRLQAENAELVSVLHEVEQEAVHAYHCLQQDCVTISDSVEHFFKKWWHAECELDQTREENAKLRDESDYVGMAAYELGRKSMTDENAKLRENNDRLIQAIEDLHDVKLEDKLVQLENENAKLREQIERLQPKDCEGNALDIADTVSMLRSEYDGDHEWDDVVVEIALTKWGGDRWIVRGSKGEAWACYCTKTGYDEDAYEGSDDVDPIDNPTLVEAENAELRKWCGELLQMAESHDPEWLHWPELHDELRKLGVEFVKL